MPHPAAHRDLGRCAAGFGWLLHRWTVGGITAGVDVGTFDGAASAVLTGVSVPNGVEQRPLTAPDGSVINTVWLGSGSTAAVLLHQTDGNGLCGMLFYASYLADHGIRSVAIDLCGLPLDGFITGPRSR